MAERKIEKNVIDFLNKASAIHGRIMEERFSIKMFCALVETEDESPQSPIEDLFFIAANLLCVATATEVNPDFYYDNKGEIKHASGVRLQSQKKIGKYRVDFLLSQHGIGPEDVLSPVIVELDGHDFHDKDKHQRSYEKARDRFLVKSGYRVIHFTGSDVVKDPFKVAHEALSMLGVFSDDEDVDSILVNFYGES